MSSALKHVRSRYTKDFDDGRRAVYDPGKNQKYREDVAVTLK
jgi:hypothetical protein